MKNRNPEVLENQIKKLIEDDSLEQLVKDYSEIGLDNLIQDELLKEVPLIKSFFAIFKFGKKVEDYFFAKKLIACLQEISEVNVVKRKRFIEEINGSNDTEEKVGETFILIISRADSISKAKLIGKLYKSYISGTIDYTQLRRLCHLVDKAFIADLESLYSYHKNHQIPPIARESLINSGAIKLTGFAGQTTHGMSQGMPHFEISELGILFIKTIYQDTPCI
ncbi:hypothetical protein [Flagellimonas lutimaris]|uniref:hypothetical protein n=1 Tax=Flagellimonas lutimaris TaxID=475082 RepID=UPI003F5CCA22